MIDERVAVDVGDQPVGLALDVQRDGRVIPVRAVHDGVVAGHQRRARRPGQARADARVLDLRRAGAHPFAPLRRFVSIAPCYHEIRSKIPDFIRSDRRARRIVERCDKIAAEFDAADGTRHGIVASSRRPAALAALGAGCGGAAGHQRSLPRPATRTPRSPGRSASSPTRTASRPQMIDPVTEANPDLKIETATFDSDDEAAAKLAGGFQADVVEVCADEMQPLLDQGLIRPLDPDGISSWDDLSFTERERDRARRQAVRGAALRRARGARLQHRAGSRGDRRAHRSVRSRSSPGGRRSRAPTRCRRSGRRRWRSGSRTR